MRLRCLEHSWFKVQAAARAASGPIHVRSTHRTAVLTVAQKQMMRVLTSPACICRTLVGV